MKSVPDTAGSDNQQCRRCGGPTASTSAICWECSGSDEPVEKAPGGAEDLPDPFWEAVANGTRSPQQYAVAAQKNAKMLAVLSDSPAKHVAFETLKVALAVLLEEEWACQMADYPRQLYEHLRGGQEPNSVAAQLRQLVELADRKVPRVIANGERGVVEEAPDLFRSIRRAFDATPNRPFEGLELEHCTSALQDLLRPNKKVGKVAGAPGVAARIIGACGAADKLWPKEQANHGFIVRAIDKALRPT